jgi:predicted 3-demethylubiquinone-9 3-methyltransferase (glyoxalase superfamily)
MDLEGCRPEPLPITVTDVRELHNALVAALVPALNFDQVRSALTGVGWDEASTGGWCDERWGRSWNGACWM